MLQASVIEDILLNYVLSEGIVSNQVESIIDSTSAVENFLRQQFVNAAAIIGDGVSKRLAYKSYLVTRGSDITTDRLLARLNKLKLNEDEKTNKNFVLYHIDGIRCVTVRIPDVDDDNPGQIDNLGLVLDAIKTLLDVRTENLKIVKDSTLGRDFHLPAKLNRLLTNMIGAYHSRDADFSGVTYEFTTKLKANLVEILAAIKLLKDRTGKLRKVPGTKQKSGLIRATSSLSIEHLKEKFNKESGLKEPGVPAYCGSLITGMLSELVKINNDRFPGVFIHSLKKKNQVRTSDALIGMMGYKPIVVVHHKLMKVFLTKTVSINSKDTLVPKNFTEGGSDNTLNFREYRAFVTLALPLISSESMDMKKHWGCEPFAISDNDVISRYGEIAPMVDALDMCFSIITAVNSERNKTALPMHFKNAFGHLLSLISEPRFVDYEGNYYAKYSDIPEHIRKYLESITNKKLVGKRDLDDSIPVAQEVPLEPVNPAPKKQKKPKTSSAISTSSAKRTGKIKK
jgi:hypothetical protein